MSTAWVTTFCMEHNWLLGLYNQEAQDDIFGSQPYIIAPGALAPNGTATPVEGGYQVTGRWEWGTGVMHFGLGDGGRAHAGGRLGCPRARHVHHSPGRSGSDRHLEYGRHGRHRQQRQSP